MHIISRKKLLEAGSRHSDLIGPLDVWYRISKKASWSNFIDLRTDFPSADLVGKITVFNIKGNEYRLIAEIFHANQTILVRDVLTHAEYDRGEVEVMNAVAISAACQPEYCRLLTDTLPSVIRNEEQNEEYLRQVAELLRREDTLTDAEQEYVNLLTLLIEDFEEKTYKMPSSTPQEAIVFLMDQHGLRQKDLSDIFGTRSITSEVLSGKRELNKQQIRRLSERFHVSPELFF